MQSDKSLMSGAGFEPPVVVGAPVPRDVTGDAMREGVVRAGANMGGVFREMVETEDFTRQLDQERMMMEMRSHADVESTRRLLLPDGDEDAFFDERGSFKGVAVKDFVSSYRKALDGVGSGIQNPELAARMRMRAAAVGDEMFGTLTKNGLKVARQKRDDTFKDCYDLAIEQKDYAAAQGIIGDAVKNGVFSPERGAVMSFEVGKKGVVNECDSLLVKNPTGLFDKLEDGSLDKYLSPLEQEGYRRKLRSIKDDEGRDGFIKSFTLVPKSVSEDSSTKKKDDIPEFTGLFTEEECGWINAIRNGRGGEAKEEAAIKAILEARAFKPSDPDSPDMEIAREKFIRKYKSFKLDEGFLARQWGIAEAANKKLATPTVDVGKIVDGIGEQNLLKNEAEYMKSYQLVQGNNIAGWEKNGIMREKYRELAGITDKDNANQAAQKFLNKETERIRNDIQARVSKSFLAWRDSTEEGQKASAVEQYEKIHSLVREATGDSSLKFSNRGGEIDKSVQDARQAQYNKNAEFLRSRGKEIYIDTRDRSKQLQDVSLGYDVSKKDLPEGILLPKAMMEGFDQEDGVVEVTFDNKRFRRFRVVGECEGDVPKMTYEVARQGAYNKDSSYNVKMRIRGGNTKEMMQEQEESSKGMNIMRDGNLNNPQSLQFKASAGLKPYVGDFVEAGKKFGVDPALLLSIAEHETGMGTSNAFLKKNNAMGVSPNGGGPRAFSSVKESIDYMAERLKKYYIDEGRTDIASIGAKYAPIGAGNDPRGLNNSWVNGVSKYYEQFNS